ncbi:MFS transporter, partial [Pseudoalteromonas shioyasakiensis]|nr:MFS transporter [Pseudoalteromonas shioyasakiensis]
ISRLPIADTLRYHWKAVLIAMGAKVVETAPFYIYGTFIVSYATSNLSFNESEALNAVVIGSLIATILIPIIGHLSDRIGRKRIYLFGIVATVLYAFPYFWMLQQGSVFLLILATVIGLGFIWGSLNAVQGTMMSEFFPAKIRNTGISLGYQLGAAFAGGTAPLVATTLLATFNNSYVPVALYMILAALVSFIAIISIKGNGQVKEQSDSNLEEVSG